MSHIQGENKTQLTLIPSCLDDYVGSDSICRVIAAFVEQLDMITLGFKYAEANTNGRPSYNPAGMLMLYIYGYMNRIRSSRRLEAETHRNVEVMWLLDKLTPDDKTICNFRKDNAVALRNTFREFSLLCNRLNLYGRELVAVDGTKIRANSNRKNIHTKKLTEAKLSDIDKKINEYMNELAANDVAEEGDSKLDSDAIREALKHLGEKKDRLTDLLRPINENDGNEIAEIDPDARIMHSNGDARPLDACYNVQTIGDSKHNLIVDFEVTTHPNDNGALHSITESAKEIMGINTISVVADKGYFGGEDITNCEQAGTTCYVATVEKYSHAPDAMFDKWNFKYDAENDCYICPNGRILPFHNLHKYKGYEHPRRDYYDSAVCKDCGDRAKCTASKAHGRIISRGHYQDALDAVSKRMKTAVGREIFRQRKKIIEHPFGTTKAVWGFRQFLCCTKERTTAKQSLAFLAYNLRRVTNIIAENGGNLVLELR